MLFDAVFVMITISLMASSHLWGILLDVKYNIILRRCNPYPEKTMSLPLTNLPELGMEVARLRREKGLTQRQLSEQSGLAQPTLAKLETGSLNEFGSRKLLRLLEVLGVGLSVAPLRGASTGFTLDDALRERRSWGATGAQTNLPVKGRGSANLAKGEQE